MPVMSRNIVRGEKSLLFKNGVDMNLSLDTAIST